MVLSGMFERPRERREREREREIALEVEKQRGLATIFGRWGFTGKSGRRGNAMHMQQSGGCTPKMGTWGAKREETDET